MKNNSLQIKIVTFLIIAIPIIVISYGFIWENANQRKTAEIEKNLTITEAYARLIEQKVAERIDILSNLALMMDAQNREHARLDELLKSLKTHYDENYYIADMKGNVIASANYGQSKQVSLKDSMYFKEAMKGKAVVTPMDKSPFSEEYVISIFVPVYAGENRHGKGLMVGVIVGELPVDFFRRTLDTAVIGKNGRVGLADYRGNYIYSKEVDNKTKLVVSNCFFETKGRDKVVVERRSIRTNNLNIFTMVRLKELGWYAVGFQPSSDISNPTAVSLAKNFTVLALLLVTIFALWRYKALLEYRNMLVKRQNAEKLALVGELAAGMAHEIRNPLTAIKGFSQLLKVKEKYAEDRELLELIDTSVEHIEGIVRETLLLSKPQKMKLSTVNLRNLVEETYKFMRNEAVLKDIELVLHCEEESIAVEGDQIHLKQVLVNIIKNAIEATPENGRITLSLEHIQKSNARITVKDTGEGIKPKDMDKIGTPFFTTKPSGTGLGLSVCKRIVEEHQGTFTIKSKQGCGTTVMVDLPISQPQRDVNPLIPEVL